MPPPALPRNTEEGGIPGEVCRFSLIINTSLQPFTLIQVLYLMQKLLLCPSLGAFLPFLNDVALDWFAAVFSRRFPGKCDGIFGCSFALWLARFARRICSQQTTINNYTRESAERNK